MAHLPQVMHIKRASWKAKPIHVLMDQIERRAQGDDCVEGAQKVEASIERKESGDGQQGEVYASVVTGDKVPKDDGRERRRWWQRLFGG